MSALIWQLWRHGWRYLAAMLAAALVLQLVLGISNIILSLPLAVAVAHNAGGALLLLCVVTVAYRARETRLLHPHNQPGP